MDSTHGLPERNEVIGLDHKNGATHCDRAIMSPEKRTEIATYVTALAAIGVGSKFWPKHVTGTDRGP